MKKQMTLAEKLHSRQIHQPPKYLYLLLAHIWKLLFMKRLGVHLVLIGHAQTLHKQQLPDVSQQQIQIFGRLMDLAAVEFFG